MKLRLVVCAMVFCFLLPAAAPAALDPSSLSPGVRVGRPAPDFTLQDLSGNWVSLQDFRGKKVLLFSWSTWCRCKYQLPALERFYREHRSPDFEILAVAADSQGTKWVSQYAALAGVSFPVLLDPMIDLQDKYHFAATENAWLIDEAGVVRMNEIGFDIRDGRQRELLLAALRRSKVAGAPPAGAPLDQRLAAAERRAGARPWSVRDQLELADLQLRAGRLDAASATLAGAVRRHPASAEARYRLGVALYRQGKIEEGVAAWEAAYRLEPTNYIYYRNAQAYRDPDRFYKELAENRYPPAEGQPTE